MSPPCPQRHSLFIIRRVVFLQLHQHTVYTFCKFKRCHINDPFKMPWDPAPAPKSHLGYYKLLSPNAGLRVSPICLGAMNFGKAWQPAMGTCEKDTAFAMLDFFRDHGGNFIDTANIYQNGESEIWLGEWMASRKCRDEMVIATKYSAGYNCYDPKVGIKANFVGNSTKSMKTSVEASLKKMQTDYIDILYVHWVK